MAKIKNETLYKLQTEDILSVAEDMGIDKTKITPEVIQSVVKGWESGLEWYEVTKIALENALEI
jgi:hypothetical protein